MNNIDKQYTNLQGFEIADFQLANYQSHPAIKAPLSN